MFDECFCMYCATGLNCKPTQNEVDIYNEAVLNVQIHTCMNLDYRCSKRRIRQLVFVEL